MFESSLNFFKVFFFTFTADKQKLLGIFTYKVQIFSLLSILYRVYFYSYGWIIPYVFCLDYILSIYFLNHVFFFSLAFSYFFLILIFIFSRTFWLVRNTLVNSLTNWSKWLAFAIVAFLTVFLFLLLDYTFF